MAVSGAGPPLLPSPVPWESWCPGCVLSPTRTLYKILDSCKQLTLAQGAGEEDPSGMVTIVTGFPLDNPSALSGPMQVGLGQREGAPAQTPSDVTAAPAPTDLSRGHRHPPVWLLSPGCPAGRCPRQRGRPERPGLLQAVEGDWLTLPPGPAVGLTPDLSCPPWQPGLPPVVTPPHADARTHSGREPGSRGLGARRGWEGWAPAASQCQGSEESAWGRRGPGHPAVPGDGGRRGVCASLEWFLHLRGRDSRALLPHPACGGRGQEGAPSSPGESGQHQVSGVLCRPCAPKGHLPSRLPPWGLGSFGALGTL